MALPTGKSVGAATNNLYEELGDSAIIFLFCLLHESRSKRCVLEEGDRQRLISTFAARAITAHKQSSANGILLNNMPKSESNITLFSDENPLTTKNPLFDEGTGTLSSPETLGKHERRIDLLGAYSPPQAPRGLRHSFLRFNSGGSGHSWTLPSRLHRKEMYDALRRQVVMDPVQWELEILKTELKDSKDMLDGLDWGNLGRGTYMEPRPLSVKEQARQFEQQAMREMKQRQSRDSRGSLSPDFLMGLAFDSPQHRAREDRQSLGSILERAHPASLSPRAMELHPPPTSPLHLSGAGSAPASPATTQPPPNPTRSTWRSSLTPLTCPLHPHPTPSSPLHASSSTSHPSPPLNYGKNPAPPPPPPLPPPLSPSSIVHLRLCSPPCPLKELKGILKNIQNIADIEKSVANMYSQIDKKQMLPRSALRPRGSIVAPTIPEVQPNVNMNSIVEELEKRFPSQSTAM
ncbi:unnamed protein product [Oncorhynchus mykiss]|uniref:Uncharacterized protein n=1 Tax=Oncorhynchus mykiss TaxID=8022 RepID=A0A060W8J3_ONCMY|nr:unnamed protein product [Oncorhynchus mykiss]